jgi:hypothetical protein
MHMIRTKIVTGASLMVVVSMIAMGGLTASVNATTGLGHAPAAHVALSKCCGPLIAQDLATSLSTPRTWMF